MRVSSQPPVQFATGELIHLVLFGKLTPPLHRWLLSSVDYGAEAIYGEQRTHRSVARAERNFSTWNAMDVQCVLY